MKTKLQIIALGSALLIGAAGQALADGTYVYQNGSIKDAMAAIPVPAPIPVPMHEAKWYIRGDIGGSIVGEVGIQTQGVGIVPRDARDIPPSIFGEVGFGRYVTPNFRVEFSTNFHTETSLTEPSTQFFGAILEEVGPPDPNPPNTNTTLRNIYNVDRTDEVNIRQQSDNLVNFYYDIRNKSAFTPYVGAGVGVSYRNLEHVTTEHGLCVQGETDFPSNNPAPTVVGACNNSAALPQEYTQTRTREQAEWLFSGAIMAGFSYDFNESVALDVGYRMLWTPGTQATRVTTITGTRTIEWSDYLHHQFRTGIRLNIF